jgi:phosphoribosylamine--glycine ligase
LNLRYPLLESEIIMVEIPATTLDDSQCVEELLRNLVAVFRLGDSNGALTGFFMKFLLVGNRGVQHALAVRLLEEGACVHVYPGQPFGGYLCVDQSEALQTEYDVIVVGAPRYVNDPVVIEQINRGAKVFGPDARAVALESSKDEFKRFCAVYGVPTAPSKTFTDFKEAMNYIGSTSSPYVIKADGPARGCGVSILSSVEDAARDLKRKLCDQNDLYYAGKVLVEEYVDGFEVAINVLINRDGYMVLPPTKPHKRRNNGDTGPIVAGMGSFAPVSVNAEFYQELHKNVLAPTINGMRNEGMTFCGCLFINLMINESGITVLEFNCRMGDPAMLTSLALIRSSVTDIMLATVNNRLPELELELVPGVALAVTLVDNSYPDHLTAGQQVRLPKDEWLAFRGRPGFAVAGAQWDMTLQDGQLKISNGVVACAVAQGATLHEASLAAYALVSQHSDLFFRTDIGTSVLPPRRYLDMGNGYSSCKFHAVN